MDKVLVPELENLPGLFIVGHLIYDLPHNRSYYRYDLMRYDKTLLTIASQDPLPTEHVKSKLVYQYNWIAYEMLDFYNSPAFQSMKEYNETLAAIDKL